MIFNRDCVSSDFHVICTLDEAGDNIRMRTYPILSRMEQQLRAFINRVMTDVAGKDWWCDWCPPGVNDKAKRRKNNDERGHEIELIDFADLLTLMTANVQDWPDNYQITANDLTNMMKEISSFDGLKKEIEQRSKSRSAWDDIFLPYIKGSSGWDDLKNELGAVIIPIRHRVMHHRPVHMYELDKVKKSSHSLRKLLNQSMNIIDERRRKELHKLNQEMTQNLKKSVSKVNRSIFGVADLIQFHEQQQAALRMAAPLIEAQKQWEQQMRPWLDMQEQAKKQMEPYLRMQKQWQREVDVIMKSVRRFL